MPNEDATSHTSFRLASLLALVVFLLLFALTLSNITEKGPATRGLAEGVAILTEIDSLLDKEFEGLEERASATSEDERVALIDFPIAVTFAPSEVLSRDQAAFRALLLERSANELYEDGPSTLRSGSGDGPSLLSANGALRRGMDVMRATPHRIFFTFTVLLAIVAACLAIVLAIGTRGYGRLASISFSILVGSMVFLALSLALRWTIQFAASASDDYVWHAFFDLAHELAWGSVRNGLIFSIAAAISFVAGVTVRGQRAENF